MRSAIALIVFAVLLSGCDTARVFEDNKDFEKRGWAVADTVAFEFSVTDAAMPYNLLYNIRNSLDYPYSRIFVNYTLEDSTHNVLATKLVGNYLFDVKTGEPQGNSGLGDIYDHRFPLLENRPLPPGKYFVRLQQYMRTDTLHGILAAGIRLEKVETKE
jgi:gliding motility-associated lipoprotein GldH